jgi:hypothetical protein
MHQGHFFPLQLQMLLNLQRTTGISRRALGQTLACEFDPQGIHVAYIIIDGQIDTARVRSMSPNTYAPLLRNFDQSISLKNVR